MTKGRNLQGEILAARRCSRSVLGEGRKEVEQPKPGGEDEWKRVAGAWVDQARVCDGRRHSGLRSMLREHMDSAPRMKPGGSVSPDHCEGDARVDIVMGEKVVEKADVNGTRDHVRERMVFRRKVILCAIIDISQ